MSVTSTPRDIARRLSAQGGSGADSRSWESFALPGLHARGVMRLRFNLNSSQSNQLITRYLAERMAKSDRRSPPDPGDDGAAARLRDTIDDE